MITMIFRIWRFLKSCRSSHLEARGHCPGFPRRMSSWWIWDFSMRQRRYQNDVRVGSDCLQTSLMPSSSWSFADWHSAGNIAPFDFSDHGCYMFTTSLKSSKHVQSHLFISLNWRLRIHPCWSVWSTLWVKSSRPTACFSCILIGYVAAT